MGRLFNRLKERFGRRDEEEDEDSGDETTDKQARKLSHVGQAAYEVLRTRHEDSHLVMWDVTTGKVVGKMDQTPKGDYFETEDEPPEGHSDWFPEKMAKIVKRTKEWCDIMSLGPPDGLFMEKLKEAIEHLNDKATEKDPIVIRMCFGNIIGMPTNCTKIIEELTKDLPENPSILLWVGAWRNGVSWNHSKIIAVDGRYLHTGGHNLWDAHYLKHSPVHDLSVELEGKVAHAAHLFANAHWAYIERKQGKFIGKIVDAIVPDVLPTVLKHRVNITEFPGDEVGEFPPRYRKKRMPKYKAKGPEYCRIITMGRKGQMDDNDKAADSAFIAMIESARKIIRLGLQDLGPVCIPGTKMPLPGCTWPKAYLSALGKVIWEKGVDVEIVLSNPGSIPGGLSGTEANYGNGWSCVDVASEIIKTIRTQFPDADDEHLREKVADNLRICFLRTAGGNTYADGNTKGMHAKHFIVDDRATYIGSQNLYVCDLSEWGVLIDDKDATEKIKEEYWDIMWKYSYTGEDVDVQAVMDGLDIDRDGEADASPEQMAEAARAQTVFPSPRFVDDHESDDEA